MTIYIILLTGIALSGFYFFEYQKNDGQKIPVRRLFTYEQMCRLYLAASCLVFTLILALRFGIGYDYYSYRDIYASVKELSVPHIMNAYRKECLFYLFCKLCSALSLSYPVFLAAAGLWIHSVAMWFIHRYSKMPWVSVYLYVAFQFLAHNMNLLRQSIAVSFFMLAYPYLMKRRLGCFLLLMVIGGLFHNSLFFVIPLYFLLPLRNTCKRTFLYIFLAAIVYLSADIIIAVLSDALAGPYSFYQESEVYWQGSSFVYTVFPAAYFLLVFLFRNRLQPHIKKENIQHIKPGVCADIAVNSAFLTAAISFFITRHFILERFSVYPFVFSLIIIPEIIDSYRIKSKQRCLALILFLFFAALYFSFAAVKGFHHVYPYISLFERAVSINHSY